MTSSLRPMLIAGLLLAMGSAAYAATAKDFNINRYKGEAEGRFPTFHVESSQSLRSVLDHGI